MAADSAPTMHVIAGPNGSGKTTLYNNRIKPRFPGVEFVNADLMAKAHFGHNATTAEESAVGQKLAEDRRQQLISERKSLCMESTFSHPSKNDLVTDAIAAGYKINVYHVNVRSADLAVARVQSRVDKGGHSVPEQKTRERYERNQALIRDAVKVADHAYVFDNSALNKPHTLTIELERGKAVAIGQNVPPWARTLYAEELSRYSPQKVNPSAASFKSAQGITHQLLGDDAATYIARPNGTYQGQILGQTERHTLQQVGAKAVIAHFTSAIGQDMHVGDQARIAYDKHGKAQAKFLHRGPHGAAAAAWQHDPARASRQFPAQAKEMAKAATLLQATRSKLTAGKMDAKSQQAVLASLTRRLASDIEHGRTVPELTKARAATSPARDLGPER